MRLTIILNAVLGALMLCGIPAVADVVTFDDIATPFGSALIPTPYHGLTWTNFAVLNAVSYANPSGYKNGMVSSPNVAFNESGNPAMTAGSPFTFNSAYFTAAWNDGLIINIVGKLGGVAVLDDAATFTVNTSGPTLETFDWTNIDELDFSSAGGTNHGYNGSGTHFAMDNMTINEAVATPEPRLLLFLIVGLACILGVQRLKASNN